MRLKIKQVQPSPEAVVAGGNGTSPPAAATSDQEEVPLRATVKEEQDQGFVEGGWLIMADEQGNHHGGTNPDDDDNNPPELSPTAPSEGQPLGKRKRKPKERMDEISPVIFRRKKKPLSASKSDQAITDGAKKFPSKKSGDDGLVTPVIKPPTLIRAEEVQASLGNEQPSFLKLLVRSHVASCFWMVSNVRHVCARILQRIFFQHVAVGMLTSMLQGLPVPFCKAHLPRKDCTMVLENESGEQFEIKYISEKTGLSAGWRKFVAAHKLVEGDVLIFQLIEPTTFKVLVIRANDLSEVDGALSLLNLDTVIKQSDANGDRLTMEKTVDPRNKKKKRPKSLPLTVVQKKKQKAGRSGTLVAHSGSLEEYSGNVSDEVASEVLEGAKSSAAANRFKDVKTFEDFQIMVNGVCIDSELPENVRRKYYELCCCKNAFLHERFLCGLHCKLAAGMIHEAVSTADAVKACKVTTSRKDFEKWDKSLKSFELLGMDVGFLRARLSRLLSLAFDFEGALETKKYWEAKSERETTEDQINKLEAKLEELRGLAEKQDADIEALRSMAENYELMFQEEVNAPW